MGLENSLSEVLFSNREIIVFEFSLFDILQSLIRADIALGASITKIYKLNYYDDFY